MAFAPASEPALEMLLCEFLRFIFKRRRNGTPTVSESAAHAPAAPGSTFTNAASFSGVEDAASMPQVPTGAPPARQELFLSRKRARNPGSGNPALKPLLRRLGRERRKAIGKINPALFARLFDVPGHAVAEWFFEILIRLYAGLLDYGIPFS